MDGTPPGEPIPLLDKPGRDRNRITVGGSVSGEHYSPALQTSGTMSTGSTALHTSARGTRCSPLLEIAPRIKHRIHALLDACITNLDQANDNSEDFFLRNNSLGRVRDSLADLWSVRSKREEQYAEVINMLQCVFLGKPVEEFSGRQIDALRRVFVKLRDEPDFDDEAANEVTAELLKGGVDVFRELA